MDDSSIYTSGEYQLKNPGWHEETSIWKAEQIWHLMEKHRLRPSRVCEIGSGAGGILMSLASRLPECQFVGYEISPQAFEIAKAKQNGRVDFRLENEFIDGEQFDIAMAIDVIEHVDDYIGFLKQMRMKARYKLFHIPLDMFAWYVLREKPLLDLRHAVGHIHYFNKDSALATLEYTGHEIKDWVYTSGLDAPGADNQRSGAKCKNFLRKVMFRANPDVAVRSLGGYSLLVLCT